VDEVRITIRFDSQHIPKRETDSPELSLLRPFRRIVEEGKPTGTINYVFFQGDTLRILGSLTYSPEGFVLFFPGISDRSMRWFSNKSRTLREHSALGIVDHFTLEPGFQKGHITSETDLAKKRYRYRSRTLNGNSIFWFAMSIKHVSVIEPMYSKVRFAFEAPESDSTRRIENIMKARDDAIFHIVSLAKKDRIADNEFLHFQFFIGDRPPKDFFVLPHFTEAGNHIHRVKIPIRIHPVALKGLSGKVWITASKHSGILNQDALFAFG
jgi:hypothetical protein